ncbi:MAG: proton-conducting transporter membrane subunit [Candidatus Firestonebacteria bacterium]
MIDSVASSIGFIVLLFFFGVGAMSVLIFRKDDKLANMWSSFFAIAGSIWGLFFAILTWASPNTIFFTVDSFAFPLLSIFFCIDKLSIFFIFVISLIALFCSIYGIGYVKHFYEKYSIGALGFFYNLFIIGMLLVVTAANGLFFLIAWEIMSVASYFLVVYDRNDRNNVNAGFLYLVMTHIGTVFIIFSFLLIYKFTGSFDFETIKSSVVVIPSSIKNIIFVMLIIGFGTKAGIVPFHIWLPSAHPAAPSHVSGLMSGVMIKTGVYMMIRFFLYILQPVPVWWGLVLLVIGSISSIIGVLYALTEHDIKRLLAYHSIENIGIILLGFGSALTFLSLNMPSLALLGFVAALFHTLNHATFKSLLFLSAGSVINETHTRNMEEYGGLIKYMPETAAFFLIGSMAISALPPFNGFFSEWLTFQSLFQGIAALDFSAKWIFIVSAGALAFTGGLALACFVKVFGVTFLARPRSQKVVHAKESLLSLRLGMGALAILSLLFGIFSGSITSVLEKVGHDIGVFRYTSSFLSISSNQHIVSGGNFASVSAPAIAVFLIAVFIIVLFATKYVVHKNQKIRMGATWDCGTDLTPRMEITATGFARSIITIFKGVLKPSIQHEIEYNDAESRYLPKSRTVTLNINDIYRIYLYEPLNKIFTILSERAKGIQIGNINVYILYIFMALFVALILMI